MTLRPFLSLAGAASALMLCAGDASAQLENLPPPPPAQPTFQRIETNTASLRWLDKLTGRINNFEAPVGETIQFGNLEIVVRTCKKNPPTETPENAAFLDVWELRAGEPSAEVFRGWMFSSSPALSAMEHPVYDVWVLECVNRSETATPSPTQ